MRVSVRGRKKRVSSPSSPPNAKQRPRMQKERKKHFSIAAITLFPVPRTPALLHLHSLPQPPVPAAQILRRFIASHHIASHRMRFPRVPGRWWLLGSPHLAGFPHPQQVRTFPVCRAPRGFLLRVHGGSRSDVVVGLHCAGRDDRPRVAPSRRRSSFPYCYRVLRSLGVEWNLGELCWPHARRFLLLSLNFVATSIEYLGS